MTKKTGKEIKATLARIVKDFDPTKYYSEKTEFTEETKNYLEELADDANQANQSLIDIIRTMSSLLWKAAADDDQKIDKDDAHMAGICLSELADLLKEAHSIEMNAYGIIRYRAEKEKEKSGKIRPAA